MEANKVLLNLEFHYKGLDEAISLFLKFLEEEQSLRGSITSITFIACKCDFSCLVLISSCITGQSKLALHVIHLCQVNVEAKTDNQISYATLISLLDLLSSRKSYNNIFLRHHVFCILQIIAGRLVYSSLNCHTSIVFCN